MAELLFWPALLAYGEAAFAYFREARAPGRPGRLATWGVRDRLARADRAARSRRPRARTASRGRRGRARSNLFVWLVVTAYLDLGLPRRATGCSGSRSCRSRPRCSSSRGSAAEPRLGARSRYSNVFLVLHVGLVLAAFAGFTLAAALAAVYLVPGAAARSGTTPAILRLPAPSLADARTDSAARTIAVSLPALTLGHRRRGRPARGDRRRARRADGRDARRPGSRTASYLALRYAYGWHGRRAAYLALAGVRARHRRPARAPGDPLRMRLSLVGISHRHAPVEVRERALRSTRAQAAALARDARGERRGVCLSTCNRTELYIVGDDGEASRARGARAARGGDEVAALVVSARRRGGGAASLPRRRAGSTRSCPARARSSARFAPPTRPARPARCSNRLFHDALHAGKKRARQTTIAESPASVSSAGAALAQQVFGDLDGRRVLDRRRRQGRRACGAQRLAARGAEIVAVAQPFRRARRASSRGRFGARRAAARRARGRARVTPTSSSRATSAPGVRDRRRRRARAARGGRSSSSTSPSRATSIRR